MQHVWSRHYNSNGDRDNTNSRKIFEFGISFIPRATITETLDLGEKTKDESVSKDSIFSNGNENDRVEVKRKGKAKLTHQTPSKTNTLQQSNNHKGPQNQRTHLLRDNRMVQGILNKTLSRPGSKTAPAGVIPKSVFVMPGKSHGTTTPAANNKHKRPRPASLQNSPSTETQVSGIACMQAKATEPERIVAKIGVDAEQRGAEATVMCADQAAERALEVGHKQSALPMGN
ncbi:hypothetical protein PIB30_052875 [Stylosanthes scabra]|uniref:Uncharacterized protein n=1 Tax=Stylosanthes scabra TaxID=79078 RepID=A0ABU6XJ80_9FABA|nr:hypothetical protein [Stylosanthes scabra]